MEIRQATLFLDICEEALRDERRKRGTEGSGHKGALVEVDAAPGDLGEHGEGGEGGDACLEEICLRDGEEPGLTREMRGKSECSKSEKSSDIDDNAQADIRGGPIS